MAKRGVPKGIRAGLKQAAALGQNMSREARADYAIALNANTVGVQNLRGQLRIQGGLMKGQLSNQQLGLLTQAGGALRTARRPGEMVQNVENKYGGALGSYAREASAPAAAVAREQVARAGAAVQQGATNLAIGANVRQIAQTAATAQQASAEYGLSQALAAREIIANETVAQLQGDLYKMAIQYNMEWKMWKKQQDYAKKLAEEDQKGGRAFVEQLIGEGGNIASGAADAWRYYRDRLRSGEISDNPEDSNYEAFNVTTAMQQWAQENGYDPTGAEALVFMRTLAEIRNNGVNTDVAWSTVMERLYSNTPGWQKWGDRVLEAGQSSIRTGALRTALDQYLARQEDDDNGGGGGGSYTNDGTNPFAEQGVTGPRPGGFFPTGG